MPDELPPSPPATAAGTLPSGAEALGKVAAPPNKESTSEFFYFWVAREKLVERTQIVTTSSTLGGKRVEFIGLVEEVYRQSRQHDMGEEVDRFDADTGVSPPFASAGFAYAKVTILRTDPVCHAPPVEESTVYLGGESAAARGYGIDRMAYPLRVGLLRNGGTPFAGPATIDLDYMLGENGGHLNVNGIAGLGAKTSFLLHVNALLLREVERQRKELGVSHDGRLQVVPIIFNVKNFDLFFIDHWGKKWETEKAIALPEWNGTLRIPDPTPFRDVEFYAPREKSGNAVNTGRTDGKVKPYSWSLADIITHGLFRFLFSEEDIYDANFGGLVGELEEYLTSGPPDAPRLNDHGGDTGTFAKLLDWFRDKRDTMFSDFVGGTKGKLLRRLKYIVQEGDGVLRRDDPTGNPLVLPKKGVEGPVVIDLFGIRLTPSLQRFVVAAVFHQLIQNRSGTKSVAGLRYLVTLDELNKFAPKGGTDPITRKIEEVAAEMRSQGVILLGAQQQASLVSPRVIENASVRAVGRSGSLEVDTDAESTKAFDLRVRRGGGEPIGVAFLSGSQRFRVAVSIALAVGRFACDRARRLEAVIIDEGFGSLDPEGLQAMAAELKCLQQKSALRRIVLVSHQPEFTEQFPSRYLLTAGPNGTIARRVPR